MSKHELASFVERGNNFKAPFNKKNRKKYQKMKENHINFFLT
jgi:hypothetical protein